MRNVSDEAAAEFAIAGVAADTATKMPIAEAALRISDWHEAKALDTMCVITLLLRPAPFLAQYRSFTMAVVLPTPLKRAVSDGPNECNICVIIAGQAAAQTR